MCKIKKKLAQKLSLVSPTASLHFFPNAQDFEPSPGQAAIYGGDNVRLLEPWAR